MVVTGTTDGIIPTAIQIETQICRQFASRFHLNILSILFT